MTIGRPKGDHDQSMETDGSSQSIGVRAEGEVEGNSVTPTGNPGVEHWQATYLDDAHLDDRGNIFFAAVEMTRMPMLITDPRQEDNPIVFVNGAFLDLTRTRYSAVTAACCRAPTPIPPPWTRCAAPWPSSAPWPWTS